MHKVIPQKDTSFVPAFNANLNDNKPLKTIETKPKTITKNQIIPPVKSAKIPTKTAKIPIKSQKISKKSNKIQKNNKETKIINEKKIKINEKALNEKNLNTTEFDKKNYVENLSTYLDNDDNLFSENSSEIKHQKELNNYDYIIRPSVSLGIVLFLILIFAWIYTRLKGINPNSLLTGKFSDMDMNKFKVLASSSLGQGKIIHLVEINGKQLVVGSTNNNINLLTEISPEDMEKLQTKAKTNSEIENKDTKVDISNDNPVLDNEFDEIEPDSYSARHSDLYKNYIDKNND